MGRRLLAALLAAMLAVAPAAAPAAPEEWAGVPILEIPKMRLRLVESLARLGRGDPVAAETGLREIVRMAPEAAAPQAALTILAATQGRGDLVVEFLDRAVARGYADAAAMAATPLFAPFAREPRLAAILARAPAETPPRQATPAPVTDRAAPVGPDNLRWNPETGLLDVLLVFSPVPPSRRAEIADPADGAPARLLDEFARRGAAAGHHGDLYDNRDRKHSSLDLRRFPSLAEVRYSEAAVAADVEYGLNLSLRFPGPVIGNSSTAVASGANWRSLVRLALTTPGGVGTLYGHYAANHLYFFPEHRDHDPSHGDVFPANTPYVLVSQGSSGSDGPFMRAAAYVYAAFRPDTKAALVERGLLAAATQMVLRRTLKGVETDVDYLTGRAHPSAFRAEELRVTDAMRLANALTPDAIPPMPRLAVAEEGAAGTRSDIFAGGHVERLFDTPSAVARIFRGSSGARRYVLDAGGTEDPNGRALRFHWRLLRGDPGRVRLKPLDVEGRRVEAIVLWHDPFPIPETPDIRTQRVDIGLFADNGAGLSAPAFFSVTFPPGESRTFREDGTPLSIRYPALDEGYADPALHPVRDWRDDYLYTPDGALMGWERRRGAKVERFSRDGARVTASDAQGRPVRAEIVRYAVDAKDGRAFVREVPTGGTLGYGYDGPDDLIGRVERNPD